MARFDAPSFQDRSTSAPELFAGEPAVVRAGSVGELPRPLAPPQPTATNAITAARELFMGVRTLSGHEMSRPLVADSPDFFEKRNEDGKGTCMEQDAYLTGW